jgi:hypothetical protein
MHCNITSRDFLKILRTLNGDMGRWNVCISFIGTKNLSEFTGIQEGNVYAASAALRLFDYVTFCGLVQILHPDNPVIFNFFSIWHLLENRLEDAEAVNKRWNHIYVTRVFPTNPEDNLIIYRIVGYHRRKAD